MLTKQKIVLAKIESSYGVDPTLVGGDAVDCRNVKVNYVGEMFDRDVVRSDLSQVAPILGKRYIEVSFEMDLRGSGSLGVVPEIDALFQGAMLSESLGGSNGSSILYVPDSIDTESISIEVYSPIDDSNSRCDTIRGARCAKCNLILESGKTARVELTYRGLYAVPTDVATPTPTYDSTIPPIVESINLTLNSVSTLVVQSLNIDLGLELVEVDDVNSAGGIKEFRHVGRKPNGAFNPEAVSVATYDFFTDWINASQRALTLQIGTTNYNKFTISCPKVTIDQISEEERNGTKVENISFRCNRNSGNDEVAITFS